MTATDNHFGRTALLLGERTMETLARCRVILFGVGGVGSWCAESLVRSGIGHLTMVDSDRVSATNINRQAMATTGSVGQVKVEAMKARLLDINPDATIEALQEIYSPATADLFDLGSYDYVIDAIDSLSNKIELILNATATVRCQRDAAKANAATSGTHGTSDTHGNNHYASNADAADAAAGVTTNGTYSSRGLMVLPPRAAADVAANGTHSLPAHARTTFFSSMGAALKMEPTRITVSEFWDIDGCPLARAIRKRMKNMERFPATKFKCVWSPEVLPNLGDLREEPTAHVTTAGRPDLANHDWSTAKARVNGTVAHTTAIFGFSLAGLVLQDIHYKSTH